MVARTACYGNGWRLRVMGRRHVQGRERARDGRTARVRGGVVLLAKSLLGVVGVASGELRHMQGKHVLAHRLVFKADYRFL